MCSQFLDGRRCVLRGCMALAWFVVWGVAPRCAAELLVYEPFIIGTGGGEYHVGPIDGQPDPPFGGPVVDPFFVGPWVSPVDAAGQVIHPDSIAFDAPGGSVRAVGNGRAGRYLWDPWDDATEGTFYLSFLVNYGALTDPETDTMGYRSVEFWPPGVFVGTEIGRMQIGYDQFLGAAEQRDPNTARLQWVLPDGSTYLISDVPFNEDSDTHAIVVKFDLHSAAASDTLSVYLDPLIAIPFGGESGDNSEPELPNAIAAGLDFTLGSMSTASYFGAASGILPAFDEIRVGTTFADVVGSIPPDNPCSEANQACYLEIISHMNLSDSEVGFADLTGDGQVTIADYRLWKDNRTDIMLGPGSSSQSVPEPASLLLGFFVLAVLATSARRSR